MSKGIIMLNAIWLGMILLSVITAVIQGRVDLLVAAVTDSAKLGFEIALGLTGIAFLAANGSLHPSSIIISSLIATTCSTFVAVLAVKQLAKLPVYQLKESPKETYFKTTEEVGE